MLNKPYITALIDTYNQGRFVEEAIESVLAQDFPMNEVEIIVVDDGSTDDTPARIRRFAGRIRYIRKPNGGQASALNAGFGAAQGEIIAFLDGDDTWRRDKLAYLKHAFEARPDVGMVYHPFEYFSQETRQSWMDSNFPAISGPVLDNRPDILRYGNLSTSGIALRRKQMAPLFPIPERLRLYADAHIAYLAFFVAPVFALTEHLTRYRLHGGNLHAGTSGEAHARASTEHLESIIAGMEEWLRRQGFSLEAPHVRLYLRRFRLKQEEFRLEIGNPSRVRLLQFCWKRQRLYGPVWTSRYRAFRVLADLASVVVGKRRFAAIQAIYASRRNAAYLREKVLRTYSIPPGKAA